MSKIIHLQLLCLLFFLSLLNPSFSDTTYHLREITRSTLYGSVAKSSSFTTSNGNYFVYAKDGKVYHRKKVEDYKIDHETTVSGISIKFICSNDDDERLFGVSSDGKVTLINFITKQVVEGIFNIGENVFEIYCEFKSNRFYSAPPNPDFIWDPLRRHVFHVIDYDPLAYSSKFSRVKEIATVYGNQVNCAYRLSDRYLLTVGEPWVQIYDLKKGFFVEEATINGGVTDTCFINKTKTLVVGTFNGVYYLQTDDIDKPHKRIPYNDHAAVSCDPSGENLIVGSINQINHHYIDPLVQTNPILTLTESFSNIAYFEKASAPNIVIGAIKVTPSQYALILYEFSLECDPSCSTCTHRCACNNPSKNNLVFSKGICVSSCSYTSEQRYLFTDKNDLNYCIGTCGLGFVSTGNDCIACPNNCAGCTAADACYSCLSERYLYGTIEGQPSLFRSCVSTNKGYFRIGSTNRAGKCMESCRTCSSADGSCNTCYNKKYV